MSGKLVKYTLRVVYCLAALILLAAIAVYLPPVQDFIKDKIISIATRDLGYNVTIERFRLKFPVRASFENTLVTTGQGDTVLMSDRIDLAVAVMPLLRKEIHVRGLSLGGSYLHVTDSVTGFDLEATLRELAVEPVYLSLKNNSVNAGTLVLRQAEVMLYAGTGSDADTVSSGAGWQIEANRMELDSVQFSMSSPEPAISIDARVLTAAVEDAAVHTVQRTVTAGSVILASGYAAYEYSEPTDAAGGPVPGGPNRQSELNVQAVPEEYEAGDAGGGRINGDRYAGGIGPANAPGTYGRPDTGTDLSTAADTLPWDIQISNITVRQLSGKYSLRGHMPEDGFDPSYIEAENLNLRVDSFHNRSQYVGLLLDSLSLTERSGLRIIHATGGLILDSASLSLKRFALLTDRSELHADISTTGPLFSEPATSRIEVNIDAAVDPSELYLFWPADAALRNFIAQGPISITASASGPPDNISIRRLELDLPGHIALAGSGTVTSLTGGGTPGAEVTFDSSLANMDFLKTYISDPALRSRIGFPAKMGLEGTLRLNGSYYAPDITLTADSGRMTVRGHIDTRAHSYDARIAADYFPLFRFLPADSLGRTTFELTASGKGFDPLGGNMDAEAELDVDFIDYRNHRFRDISFDASVRHALFDAHITAGDTAVNADIHIDGTIADDLYTANAEGVVNTINLQSLGLSGSKFTVGSRLELSASANLADSSYSANVVIDTMIIHLGDSSGRFGPTKAVAHAGLDSVSANIISGDLLVDFRSPLPLRQLSAGITATSEEIRAEFAQKALDMNKLQRQMPEFTFSANAGADNILHALATDLGYGFDSLRVSIGSDTARPFRAWIVADGFSTGGLRLDTLNVGLRQRDSALGFYARLANRPGNIDQMALITAYGTASGDSIRVNLRQRDRADSTGFQFTLAANLEDSAVRVSILPQDPVFGYERWSINADNYVTYNFNNTIAANVRLDAPGQHFYLGPASLNSLPDGALRVDMAGIDIGNTLRLFPSAPDIQGKLSGDITAGFDPPLISAKGAVEVDELYYDRKRIGDFALEADFQSDSLRTRLLDARLTVNGRSALSASGFYAPGPPDSLSVDLDMPGLPLQAINVFLGENTATITGNVQGELSVTGGSSGIDMNGSLGFTDATVTVDAIGTTYALPGQEINIERSTIVFDDYSIMSPSGTPLTIDGEVDLADLSNPYVDLEVTGSRFDAVNSQRTGGSMVYGTALLDIDLSAKGEISELVVRGDVELLNGSDVTYTLQSDPLAVQDQAQNIVTFVDFSDTTSYAVNDSVTQLRVWGMDILVNADIDDAVKMTLNLSDEGNDRVEVTGQGQLTYSLNSQGDSRFTGRYDISAGTVAYNPPVISEVDFAIRDGSYVEWTGEMTNPSFNITASETKRTTVTSDDGSSSVVNFEVSVHITNTLEDLSLVFDLAAPNDITIQNQLASLSPDERSSQALSLLIYNMYTGPGTTARVDSNNPLNTFVERELNQWARNNLKGVDLSFGIDSYDDSATGGSQHTDYSYRLSKTLFDDRVTVTVGGSLNSDSSVEDNLSDNFVDDISIEYRLTRRENIFLKAYRYNTYENILEGEVTDTGVGFVLRRKLNRISDMFKFRRSPEQKMIRQRSKEIRRELRQSNVERGADGAKIQRQREPELSVADKTTAQKIQ